MVERVYRAGKTIRHNLNSYIKSLMSDLEGWSIASEEFFNGYYWLVDPEGERHPVTVYRDGDDLFAYIWFQYDGQDCEFTGVSYYGNLFEIIEEVPVRVY